MKSICDGKCLYLCTHAQIDRRRDRATTVAFEVDFRRRSKRRVIIVVRSETRQRKLGFSAVGRQVQIFDHA